MRALFSGRTLATLSLALLLAPVVHAELSTEAERSGYQRTGRYPEVLALCDAFQSRYPRSVSCQQFGTSPEGRSLRMLVASGQGLFKPEQARAAGLPVILVQGGIHAGEIDGKDAGFKLLRDLLDGSQPGALLDKVVLVFVPVFNVDGHERFGRWNRPNQRGPEAMGWRTTAQNYNLNRDYAKADAPEMQAMLALVEAWDPILSIDLHVTDGAQFEHDVAVMVEPVHSGDAALRPLGLAFRTEVVNALEAAGSKPLDFYPSFRVDDDPASGFDDVVSPPRFSTGYFPLRNRFAMLVETHSWRTYPERVRSTYQTVLASLRLAAMHGTRWQTEAAAADQRASELGGNEVALSYTATEETRELAFKGYAYTRTPSEVSGQLMTRYDETQPQTWRIPLHYEVTPSLSAVAPKGGYLVPAAHAAMVGEKLRQHGIRFQSLRSSLLDAKAQAFRAQSVKFDATPVEGHQRVALTGAWADSVASFNAGSLFVPIAQPKARLVMALLEPTAPDSLAAWGRFNNAFEQKEYMEAYVAEQVAREQMAADPALKRTFEQRLRDDPAFAANPAARLQFFYQRHPSWDTRLNLYPVHRIDHALDQGVIGEESGQPQK